MTPVYIHNAALPPVNEKEVLRYAACRQADDATLALLRGCAGEALPLLQTRVCYVTADVRMMPGGVSMEHIFLPSRDLARNLSGCTRAVIFAATLGTQLDRLIAKYGAISPARALMMQALGAERIEALCDGFCSWLEEDAGVSLRPRFSPGYGDLQLSAQRELFDLLDCRRHIGLHLTDSLVMTPSKSVTAIAGLGEKCQNTQKCTLCNKTDCIFRRSI